MARVKSSNANLEDGVQELRRRLHGQALPPLRSVDGDDVDWHASPAGTDVALQRFLVARKGDVTAAMNMYVAHLEWRCRMYPIPRVGLVAEVIDEGNRFVQLDSDPDGRPVFLLNCLFGNFTTDRISEVDLVLATLRFFEDTLASVESRGTHQLCCVVFGVPPPVAWSHVMVKALQDNFPERLKLALIYPVPQKFVSLVRAVLWFVDEKTRSKIDVECEESLFLNRFQWRIEQIPEYLRGGCDGVVARWEPDESKCLRLAFSFLMPHRKEVAELQNQLYAAALASKVVLAKKTKAFKSNGKEPPPESWFMGCCVQRPKSHSEKHLNARDPCHAPAVKPLLHPERKRKSERSSVCLSVILFLVSFVLALFGAIHFYNYIASSIVTRVQRAEL